MEEDRGRDWSCLMCRERNFAKRQQCFKCNEPRGNAGAAPRPPPSSGTTCNGMVKSYNKKGFGFIMCMGMDECQDVYYTRESVSSRLLHPDMPGEHVTFEIKREGRRLVAVNIRPLGEEKNASTGRSVGPAALVGAAAGSGGGKGGSAKGGSFVPGEEDRTNDWNCPSCGQRNFMRRSECFRCKNPRAITGSDSARGESNAASSGNHHRAAPSAPPRRTFSPHAGARAIKESMLAAMGAGGGRGAKRDGSASGSSPSRKRSSPSRRRKKKRKRSRSKSSESSSSESRSKKKAKRKKGKKRHSSSSSGSKKSKKSKKGKKSSSSSGCEMEKPGAAAANSSGNPEIDAAKSEALEQLLKLRSVEPMETRMSEWRALLRRWHPDKNPERQEVATAVFQFLQKGKPMLDAK